MFTNNGYSLRQQGILCSIVASFRPVGENRQQKDGRYHSSVNKEAP
jgi:hypothetical protein